MNLWELTEPQAAAAAALEHFHLSCVSCLRELRVGKNDIMEGVAKAWLLLSVRLFKYHNSRLYRVLQRDMWEQGERVACWSWRWWVREHCNLRCVECSDWCVWAFTVSQRSEFIPSWLNGTLLRIEREIMGGGWKCIHTRNKAMSESSQLSYYPTLVVKLHGQNEGRVLIFYNRLWCWLGLKSYTTKSQKKRGKKCNVLWHLGKKVFHEVIINDVMINNG